MSDKTKIEWAERSWNPIVGCTIHSPGCKNCYAMRMAARLEAMATKPDGQGNHGLNHYIGTTEPSQRGAVWTGKIGIAPDETFAAPLRRKKPTDYFVNSMSDLFHESVPFELVDRVFAVMALSPQHIYKILTKRSDRMRDYMTARNGMGNSSLCKAINDIPAHLGNRRGALEMPLPNVWLGVSVEDQTRADERREDFRNTPAAVKFVSYEPALGYVNWAGWAFVDQIIGGGESGPKARPSHPQWFRDTRDWCAAEDVHYFHKQNGEWMSVYDRDRDDPEWNKVPKPGDWDRKRWLNLAGGQGFHGDRLNMMQKVGKKRAGRLLDGVEHIGMPGAAA